MAEVGDKDEGPSDEPRSDEVDGEGDVNSVGTAIYDQNQQENILYMHKHRAKQKLESATITPRPDKSQSKSGPAMSDPPSREEMAARLEAVEARSDTKYAQLLGEMRTQFAVIDTRLGALERTTAGTKMTIVGTAIGAVAVVVAVLAYGQTWFGIGVTSRDTIKAIVTEVVQQQTQPRLK